MGNLPIQTGQTVEVQQAPGPFSTAKFTPDDFGAGIGKGLLGLGQAIQKKEEEDQRLRADFDATNADHEFVKQEAQLWDEFKTKYRPDQYKDKLSEYQTALERLSPQVMKDSKLSDPIAQKLFHSMTRRRIDYRMAHAAQFAGDASEKWMDNEAMGTVDKGILHAQTQPPKTITTPEGAEIVDTRDLGVDLNAATRQRMARLSRQMPEDKAAAYVHKDHIAIIEGALNGYAGSEDYKGARAFLDAPIIGVNDADGLPMTPRRVLGARAKVWEGKFKEAGSKKEGDLRGFTFLDEADGDPVAAMEAAKSALKLPATDPGHLPEDQRKAAFEAIDNYSGAQQRATHKQNVSDQEIIYAGVHRAGDSLDTFLATMNPEESKAWIRQQRTGFKEHLIGILKQDEVRDMTAMLAWSEWVRDNYERASGMSPKDLLAAAHDEAKISPTMDKYLVPRIERFLSEKVPARAIGKARQHEIGMSELMHAMGKEYDPARPELNRYTNWPNDLERQTAALYEEKLNNWLGNWYGDPNNAKSSMPSPQEFAEFKKGLFERVPITLEDQSAGQKLRGLVSQPTELSIQREARALLKPTGSGTTTLKAPTAPPKAAPAGVAPLPADRREAYVKALRAQGAEPTESMIQFMWNEEQKTKKGK